MSKRLPSVVVRDIILCTDRIKAYTANISYDEFCSNYMAVEACLYNIQIIGEAVVQIDNDIKQRETGIPWALIKGMRNKLIHEYFGTDLQVVWNVVKNELPGLKVELLRIQKDLSSKRSITNRRKQRLVLKKLVFSQP